MLLLQRLSFVLTLLENRQLKTASARISEMKGMDTSKKHAHNNYDFKTTQNKKKHYQHAQWLKWRHSLARTIWNHFFLSCFEFPIYALGTLSLWLYMYAKQQRMNEWMTVGWTNESWINHLWIDQKHVLFPYNSNVQLIFFYWTRAYHSELECIRSELWFTLFFLLIQHSTNNKKANWLYCYHNFCYFYMLWIIVELFALFHTFAEVNEPMQLYRQSFYEQKNLFTNLGFPSSPSVFLLIAIIYIKNATAVWTNFCLVEIAFKITLKPNCFSLFCRSRTWTRSRQVYVTSTRSLNVDWSQQVVTRSPKLNSSTWGTQHIAHGAHSHPQIVASTA